MAGEENTVEPVFTPNWNSQLILREGLLLVTGPTTHSRAVILCISKTALFRARRSFGDHGTQRLYTWGCEAKLFLWQQSWILEKFVRNPVFLMFVPHEPKNRSADFIYL